MENSLELQREADEHEYEQAREQLERCIERLGERQVINLCLDSIRDKHSMQLRLVRTPDDPNEPF